MALIGLDRGTALRIKRATGQPRIRWVGVRPLWLVVLAVGVLGLAPCVAQADDPLISGIEAFVATPTPPVPTASYPFSLQVTYNSSAPGWVRGSVFELIDGRWSLLTDGCWYDGCIVNIDADSPEGLDRSRDRTFKAVLYSEGEAYTSSVFVVHERRPHFAIDVDVESSPGYFGTYIEENEGGTDLSTVIHEDDGALASCNIYWHTCNAEMTTGHIYYASVEDPDGNVYGITPSYRATSSTTATKETADQIDLPRLGASFATTTDVCNALLTFPYGSHVEEESPSDQWIACDTAVANRLSMTAVLQAIAVAGTGATHVMWWLQHQATVQVLSPAWPTVPWPDVQVPAVEDLPQVWQGAVLGVADHYMLQARGRDLAQAAAMTIAATCLWDASGIANDGLDVCKTLPIFVTGSDVAEATDHDVEAIAFNPAWFKLNYEYSRGKAAEVYQDRYWFMRQDDCRVGHDEDESCDEYPFWASEQGGSWARPQPSLKYIDSVENRNQGLKYANFITTCGLRTGTPHENANSTGGSTFLVVALPSGLGIPSYTGLCNR